MRILKNFTASGLDVGKPTFGLEQQGLAIWILKTATIYFRAQRKKNFKKKVMRILKNFAASRLDFGKPALGLEQQGLAILILKNAKEHFRTQGKKNKLRR